MHLERLTQAESKIVGEVLRAAANGPFFPDWEFHTLFGLERDQVRQVAVAWPTPIMDPHGERELDFLCWPLGACHTTS